VDPSQGAEVTFESQALRNLEVCDDFAFDCLRRKRWRSGFHDSEKRRFREVLGSHLSLKLNAKDYDLNGAFGVKELGQLIVSWALLST
jgi:hypothetical protein